MSWEICECSCVSLGNPPMESVFFWTRDVFTLDPDTEHRCQKRLRMILCQLSPPGLFAFALRSGDAFCRISIHTTSKMIAGIRFPPQFTMWRPRKMNSTNTAATYFISPAHENEMSSRDTYPSRGLDTRQNLIKAVHIRWNNKKKRENKSVARPTLRENYQLPVCFLLQEKNWRYIDEKDLALNTTGLKLLLALRQLWLSTSSVP